MEYVKFGMEDMIYGQIFNQLLSLIAYSPRSSTTVQHSSKYLAKKCEFQGLLYPPLNRSGPNLASSSKPLATFYLARCMLLQTGVEKLQISLIVIFVWGLVYQPPSSIGASVYACMNKLHRTVIFIW